MRGIGIFLVEGVLGLGKLFFIAVVFVGLVRVVLLILLGGFVGIVFWIMGGLGEEVACVSCVVFWLLGELELWLLNVFIGCRRVKGDGVVGERNLFGEGIVNGKEKLMFLVKIKYKLNYCFMLYLMIGY